MESTVVNVPRQMLYALQRNEKDHNCECEYYSPGMTPETCKVKIKFPYQQPAHLFHLAMAATTEMVSFYTTKEKKF